MVIRWENTNFPLGQTNVLYFKKMKKQKTYTLKEKEVSKVYGNHLVAASEGCVSLVSFICKCLMSYLHGALPYQY